MADEIHERLREHFRDRLDVEVIVERRSRGERRSGDDRRQRSVGPPAGGERRRPGKLAERRGADRRAAAGEAPSLPLPDWARPFRSRLRFVARFEPVVLEVEDFDTGRLVARVQSGEEHSLELLYERYFHRVYGFLRPVIASRREVEGVVRRLLAQTVEDLSRYNVRGESFRAWLFAAARDEAVAAFRRRGEVAAAALPEPGPGAEGAGAFEHSRVAWMSDRVRSRRFGRLPVDQRRVLACREILELSVHDSARALGRAEADVRALESRALACLRTPRD